MNQLQADFLLVTLAFDVKRIRIVLYNLGGSMVLNIGHLYFVRVAFTSLLITALLFTCSCSVTNGQTASQVKLNRIATSGEISEITLERSICEGDCPAYKVIFHRNGSAIYIGEARSQFIGMYEADPDSCPECYFAQLSEWLELQKFFDMQDTYNENLVDSSKITVSVVHGGVKKTVISGDSRNPIELWGIAMAIDGVISKIKWKKKLPDQKHIKR